MMEELKPYPATWVLALAALLIPVLIGLGFVSAFELANRPAPIDYRADPRQTGQEISDQNDGLVLLHAVIQVGFVLAGGWWLKPQRRARIVFLVIAIPAAGLVFLISLAGSVAK